MTFRFITIIILIIGFNITKINGNYLDNLNNTINTDSCRCNFNCLTELKDTVNSLSIEQIYRFLAIFSKDCKNNAEFSEVSNERLFKIMELNPDNFIQAIDKYNKDIEINKIIEQIRRPCNDMIDLKGIYDKIQKSKVNSGYKVKILDALQYAINLFY